MRPDPVVLFAPVLYQHLRLQKSHEYLTVEELVPELAVKRFDVAIFPGTSRLYIKTSHSQVTEPFANRFGCEFRPVVRADMLWDTSCNEQIRKLMYHSLGRYASLNCNIEAFPCILVHDVQYPERPAVMGS